jgi:hypothetical protein
MANNKRQHTQKSALGVLSPQDLLQIGQGAVLDVEVTPPAQDGSRNGTLHLWSSSYPAPAQASLQVCRLPPRPLQRSPALTGVSAPTPGDRGRVLVAGARPPAAGKDQGEAAPRSSSTAAG